MEQRVGEGRKEIQTGMSGEWDWEVFILQGGHGRIKEFRSSFLRLRGG